ncbi:MAG: RecX family transcriptional regulator [Patescibacteria group bacterium]|nr:RecX family transcriptional regulator [Patescibacteria group bacterium]
MAKITKIEQQKRGARVNIYIDGEFVVGLPNALLIDYDLHIGKELTDKEITKLKNANVRSKCLDSAYRFLSFRPRSEKEMRDKLSEKKYDPTLVDKVVKELKLKNYVNDKDFVRFWVENRAQGRGKRMLTSELLKKGVKKEDIDEGLSEITENQEYDNALKLVKNKKKYQELGKHEAYNKVGSFLSRRGYSYDIVKKLIRELYE